MNSLSDALVIGIITFILGILICLAILSAFGRLNLGDLFRRHANDSKGGNSVTDIDARRLREIYNLISKLTATLKYQNVLEIALDLGARVLATPHIPAERLASAVLLFTDTDYHHPALTVGSARHFTPTDMRVVLPGTSGLIGEVITEGAPKSQAEPAKDPELSRIVALRSSKVAYCLPLRAGVETYGVLLFAHSDPEFFTQSKRELLDIIAYQSVIAIQNARLYSDIQREKERMIEIQEQEHHKLARDLHDGPTQSMAAIAMRLNFARRLLERDPKATADELSKIEDLARRTTKEIRHMLFTLRPLELESQGLIGALKAMAEKTHETYNQNVIVEAEENIISQLEMSKQTIIFYIAEEAINNACKYAQANHIWVRMKDYDTDLVLLEIQDDGVGFDKDHVESSYDQRGSLGLKNMSERTEMVNGIFHLDSEIGKGTTIRVLIPLTDEATERLRRGG
ncbi:MAG TPA: GAF domain-containing sensor histidine kinase [Anaerolineales bacterium]|nr:GAF domain-containing sensor histidine kinase [Anaerolineales bacterium]